MTPRCYPSHGCAWLPLLSSCARGVSTLTFPFKLAVTANREEAPRQGTPYTSWE